MLLIYLATIKPTYIKMYLKQDLQAQVNAFRSPKLAGVRIIYQCCPYYSVQVYFIAVKSDLDVTVRMRSADFCGSCYGGVAPESGCCQTCEDVRQAYSDRGWSFTNPDNIEQVRCAA